MPADRREALPAGSTLDCYRVLRLIGQGGFSLIYLAEDEETHEEIAIKEYFPKAFGERSSHGDVLVNNPKKKMSFERGRRLFYQEAQTLAQLDHANIVRVRNCFHANGTAYLAMDHEPGKNLGTYLKKRRGGLSTRFIMNVFPPLLEALDALHASGNLHLDIKPSNVHLRPGGNPLLLDFGAAYQLDSVGVKKAQVVTPGFSPLEQYALSSEVGPCSDMYATGASMRACIEGKAPPSAVERNAGKLLKPAVEAFGKHYPQKLLEAIDWAMQVEAVDRPQTASELHEALLEAIPSSQRAIG